MSTRQAKQPQTFSSSSSFFFFFFLPIFVLSTIVRLQVMNHNVTRYLSICSNPSPKEKHD